MNWEKRARDNPTEGWTVNFALWLMLLVAIIFFCGFALVKIRQTHAQREVQQIKAIAAENQRYCEKWGFPVGTSKHTVCTLDLQELRAKVEQHAD